MPGGDADHGDGNDGQQTNEADVGPVHGMDGEPTDVEPPKRVPSDTGNE